MIRREIVPVLFEKLKAVDAAFNDLSSYSDSRFKEQVSSIKQYFENTKFLLDNLARISSAHNKIKGATNDKLEKTYQVCSKSSIDYFDRIVRILQFHDIIQQRLAHIIEVNIRVETELGNFQRNESVGSLSYASLICEVIELYLAQLELIKKEYHQSFEEVKANLIGLSREINKVKEMTWDYSETGFFIDKQTMDLPDYITECMGFERELFQSVLNIDSETAFIDNTLALVKEVKGSTQNLCICTGPEIRNEEKEEVIKKLNQIFTMETEREIWYRIVSGAGFAAVLDSEKQENVQDNDIDLF